MNKLHDLQLKPGEVVFVDGVTEGVARLVIGKEGERAETVKAEELPEGCRKEGVYLRVREDGSLKRDEDQEREAKEETDSLMDDIFGGPPPE
jgi:hypothetical protein